MSEDFVQPDAGHRTALADKAELAVMACLPLLPLNGSWESGPHIDGPGDYWFDIVPVDEIVAVVEASQSEIAASGENGGGGNRTRVTSHPDAAAVQGEPESSTSDSPRPSACNTPEAA